MTVGAETPINTYTGNGSTTVFGYTFRVEAQSELKIYFDEVEQTSGFSVSGIGDNGGGSVTFSTAPGNGVVILFLREMPTSRGTDYQSSGDFRADTVNEDFDRIWLKLQEIEREIDYRTLNFENTDPRTPALNRLPVPVENRALVWDSNGAIKNVILDNISLTDTSVNAVHAVNVVDLIGLSTVDKMVVIMKGFYTAGDGGAQIFFYDVSASKTLHNGITVIDPNIGVNPGDPTWWTPPVSGTGVFKALYPEKVSSKQAGCHADGVNSDTAGLKAFFELDATLILSDGIHIWDDTARHDVSADVVIRSETGIIKFINNVDDYAIKFTGSPDIVGVTFDGDDNYFCDVTNSYFSLLRFEGQRVDMDRCHIKNILGIENRFGYGIHIHAKTKSDIRHCRFNDIRTTTTTAATSGFCGGIFITTNRDSIDDMVRSTHDISFCHFEDIYTVANAASTVFPDSDAIRTFVYDPGTITAETRNEVRETRVNIDNCWFYNVLKSGCKVQDFDSRVSNIDFIVDNDRGQTQVYAAVRYELGDNFQANNINVAGDTIGFAVIAAGTKSQVTNVTFDSSLSTASAILVGPNPDCTVIVDGVTVDRAETLMTVSTNAGVYATNLFARTSNITRAIILYLNGTGFMEISNLFAVQGDVQLLEARDPSSTFTNLKISDSEFASSASQLITADTLQPGRLELSRVRITGGWNSLYADDKIQQLVLSDCEFSTNKASPTNPLLYVVAADEVDIHDCKFEDQRTTLGGDFGIRVDSVERIRMDSNEYQASDAGFGSIMRLRGANTTSASALISKQRLVGAFVTSGADIDCGAFYLARVDNCDIDLSASTALITMLGNTAAFANSNSGKTLAITAGPVVHNSMVY
jgi:hypothetical protein